MTIGGPLSVETTRDGCVEMRSGVIAAIVDSSGTVVAGWGDIDRLFPARSTIKPLQALPLLVDGAADALALTDAELALACASHNGEDGHAAAVESWLARIGLTPGAVHCPPAYPLIEELAIAHAAGGGSAERSRHNCSGKHAGFVTLAIHLGFSVDDYLDPHGPLQARVLTSVSEHCRVQDAPLTTGRDGCGAPTPFLSPRSIATGWGSLLDAGDDHAQRLVGAMAGHPWELGGTYRFDTKVPELTGGRVLTKIGADGHHVGLLRDAGLAVATKSIDGSRIAAQAALTELILRYSGLDGEITSQLPTPSVVDDAGTVVGAVSVRG